MRLSFMRIVDQIAKRPYSQTTAFHEIELLRQMSAWKLEGLGNLSLINCAAVPFLQNPNEILIEVKAASVNPLDRMMVDGYGQTYLKLLRQLSKFSFTEAIPSFPQILGRDCSGVVVDVGPAVKKFAVGDEVFCAPPVYQQGCFAQYVVVPDNSAALKPTSLSHIEAASLPFAACTAWSALCYGAGLKESNTGFSNVLIHGGSGGVGTIAVQLLKAWNANVTVTCSASSKELLKGLGSDNVLDYAVADASELLKQLAPFDVILDCSGVDHSSESLGLLGAWRGCAYVTLATPLLRHAEQLGFPIGLAASAQSYAKSLLPFIQKGCLYNWSFFWPNSAALEEVARLADMKKIQPVVERVYDMNKLLEAIENFDNKADNVTKRKGKIVIDISS